MDRKARTTLEKEKAELEARIVSNLGKMQTLEAKAFSLEEQLKMAGAAAAGS
jgi:roadblock/LC7 domain-containing protein